MSYDVVYEPMTNTDNRAVQVESNEKREERQRGCERTDSHTHVDGNRYVENRREQLRDLFGDILNLECETSDILPNL
eukprot:1358986-Amorphochlora_amoeboformis.AAC.1